MSRRAKSLQNAERLDNPRPVAVVETVVPSEGVYAFPRNVFCPRCGAYSKAYKTRGELQYRRCDASSCRNSFRITGRLYQI